MAGASDVSDVVAGGELVVCDGVHRAGDVAHLLAEAIDEIWAAVERDHDTGWPAGPAAIERDLTHDLTRGSDA